MATKSRPSFETPGAGSAPQRPTGWVYRSSDATAPPEPAEPLASAGEGPSVPDHRGEGALDGSAERHARAVAIVKKFSAGSAAAGLLPVPWLDAAIVGGVQWKMIRALAVEYGVPCDRQRLKAALGATVGGLATRKLGYRASGAVLKSFPGLGGVIGAVAVPVSAYTLSYAIGRAFMKHFASGGTLSDVDANRLTP